MAPLQALLFGIEFKHAQCCEQKDDVSIFAGCSRCDMTGQFVPQDFDVSYLAKGGWQHLCFSESVSNIRLGDIKQNGKGPEDSRLFGKLSNTRHVTTPPWPFAAGLLASVFFPANWVACHGGSHQSTVDKAVA